MKMTTQGWKSDDWIAVIFTSLAFIAYISLIIAEWNGVS